MKQDATHEDDDAVEIFLVRHAIAEPAADGAADASRRLTERGRTRFASAVRGLDAIGVRFDRVVYSPWARAAETAEILGLLCDGRRVASKRLAQRPTRALLDEIRGKRVALVGHDPWIGQLCSMLVTGDVGHGDSYRFKKGGVVWLEGTPEPGGCRMVAMLPPAVLRHVRR